MSKVRFKLSVDHQRNGLLLRVLLLLLCLDLGHGIYLKKRSNALSFEMCSPYGK